MDKNELICATFKLNYNIFNMPFFQVFMHTVIGSMQYVVIYKPLNSN